MQPMLQVNHHINALKSVRIIVEIENRTFEIRPPQPPNRLRD